MIIGFISIAHIITTWILYTAGCNARTSYLEVLRYPTSIKQEILRFIESAHEVSETMLTVKHRETKLYQIALDE